MKLKFLLRTTIDLWAIKNKKCVVCAHLVLNGNLSCNYRRQNYYKTSFSNTCENFKYLREYKELK